MTPLKYYWKVVYNDNTTFSQFNSDGSENMWKDVNQSNVVKVSWRQFSLTLSRKIESPTKWVLLPSEISLDIADGDDIFICRRNHIDFSARGEKGRRIEYILGRNKEEIIKL